MADDSDDSSAQEDPPTPEVTVTEEANVSRNRKKKWHELSPGGLRTRTHRIRRKLRTALVVSNNPVGDPTDDPVDDPSDDPTDDPVDDPTDDRTNDPVDENVLVDVLPSTYFTPNRHPAVTSYIRSQLNQIVTRQSLVRAPVNNILGLFPTKRKFYFECQHKLIFFSRRFQMMSHSCHQAVLSQVVLAVLRTPAN